MEEERAILLGKPKRKGKWRRRCVFTVGILLALLFGVWLIVARSPMTRKMIVPQIESYLSVQADADRARIGYDGVVTVRGLRLTVPGFARPGETAPPHARFFELDTAKVYLDWGGVLAGKPRIDRVEVSGGTIRLSQSTESGQLNISGLAFISSNETDESLQLPQLIAEGFTVELGEHSDAGYRKLRTIDVAGQLQPPNAGGVSKFQLTQTNEAISWSSGERVPIPMSGVIRCEGEFSEAGVSAAIRGVSLAAWQPADLPESIRGVLDTLDLAGSIPEVKGELNPSGDFRLSLVLQDVGVTLPFAPDRAPDTRARLTGTDGIITVQDGGVQGELEGMLGGLEYGVDLQFNGFSANAPFACTLTTSFRLEQDLEVLVFAPDEAIEKLGWFGDPTADVSAEINVSRGEPTGDLAASPEVSGVLRFTNGTAAYQNFSYPFRNMRGVARFSRDDLVIEEIHGEGPNGARLFATATFAPLGEESEANISVRANQVPIDSTLLAAMSEDRAGMVRHLFNEARYEELLEAGLVMLPEERVRLEAESREIRRTLSGLPTAPAGVDPRRDGLEQRLVEVDQQLRTPAFAFGGTADVTVDIHRAFGIESIWTKDIRVALGQVGVVPKLFPLPMRANGVRLAIDDKMVSIEGGVFSGLTGGRATVTTDIKLVDAQGNSIPDAIPELYIKARDMPIDERLLAAIPATDGRATGQGLGGILQRLNPEGFVNATVDLGARDHGALGYDVRVPLQGVTIQPLRAAARQSTHPGLELLLDGGAVWASEERVIVDVGGSVVDLAGDWEPAPFEIITEVGLNAAYGGVDPFGLDPPLEPYGPPRSGPSVTVEAAADSLELSLPVEDLAAVVSPSIAQKLIDLKAQRRPEGRVWVESTFAGHVNGALEGRTEVVHAEGLAADVGGQRTEIREYAGVFGLETGDEPLYRFDKLGGRLLVDGESGGLFRAEGVLPLATAGDDPERFHLSQPGVWDRGLNITLDWGRYDTELVRMVAKSRLSPEAYDTFLLFDLKGDYTASVLLDPIREQPDPAVFPGEAVMPKLAASGTVKQPPTSLVYRGTPVDLGTTSGSIHFDGSSGTFENLLFDNPNWRAKITDGPWAAVAGVGVFVDLAASMEVTAMDLGLRALLPIPLVETMDVFEVSWDEPLRVSGAQLELDIYGDGTPPVFDFAGTLNLAETSMRAGVGLAEIQGSIDVVAANTSGRPIFNMDLGLDRIRGAGVRLVDLVGRVHNDRGPGAVNMEDLLAEIHGGRLAGSIEIDPIQVGSEYAVDLRVTGARAGPVFSDLGMGADRMPVAADLPADQAERLEELQAAAWADARDRTRGILSGLVTLTGESQNPAALFGRGRVDVMGGSVVEIPGLLPIIELSNLQLPSSSRLDLARGEFYLDGDRLFLDELSLSSESIELYGGGTVKVPEVEVDLWLRSRPLSKIPVLSDLFRGIRDELVTTTIKGRPGDIAVSSQPFIDTRRALGELFGNDPTPSRARADVGRGRIEFRPMGPAVEPILADDTDPIDAEPVAVEVEMELGAAGASGDAVGVSKDPDALEEDAGV